MKFSNIHIGKKTEVGRQKKKFNNTSKRLKQNRGDKQYQKTVFSLKDISRKLLFFASWLGLCKLNC